jgi:hypothetical protein
MLEQAAELLPALHAYDEVELRPVVPRSTLSLAKANG